MSDQPRVVYFVSDSTGITAESYGRTLLSQFGDTRFDTHYMPFIDNLEKAEALITQIDAFALSEDQLPIVFATMADREIHDCLKASNCHYYELFDCFMPTLIEDTGLSPVRGVGKAHAMEKVENYDLRIDTINYAMTNDDGTHMDDYEKADVILLGVSRSGKTPTCLYLALHFHLRAANYPITEDDFARGDLPEVVLNNKHKIFALTIDPERLANIRERRRPLSKYAELKQCRREVALANEFYERYEFDVYDSTSHSIEELTSLIVTRLQNR